MSKQSPSFLGILLAVSTSALLGCEPGKPSLGEQHAAIINGEGCDEETMPSAVALLIDAKIEYGFPGFPPMEMPIRTVLCTGTLIAPDVVLSAAHCVDPSILLGGMGTLSESTYYISFTSDLTSMVSTPDPTGGMPPLPELPPDAVEVLQLVGHPGFDPADLQGFTGGLANLHDVGLLFLKNPVTTVEPAIVVTAEEVEQVNKDREVDIAGWGQQTAAPQNPFVPPPAGTVGKKICAHSFINAVGEHEMQIGDGSDTSRKCHGDSGGPSYMTVETTHHRKERVVGITSHAFDQTDCAKGGVDTRVSAWLDWIDETMKQACKDGTRTCDGEQGIIPPSAYDPPPPEPDLGVDASPDGGDGGDAGDAGSIDGNSTGDATNGGSGGCDCAVAASHEPPRALLLLLLAIFARRSSTTQRPMGRHQGAETASNHKR